jgi:hypothetical protein
MVGLWCYRGDALPRNEMDGYELPDICRNIRTYQTTVHVKLADVRNADLLTNFVSRCRAGRQRSVTLLLAD